MGIINKRADELKPGDVMTGKGHVVKSVSLVSEKGSVVVTTTNGVDFHVAADSMLEVLVPEFTPAQLHADELLAFVEAAAASPARTALLEKVHPLMPPTEAEYLAVLTAAHEGKDPDIKTRLAALLARATRAAALKGK